MKFVREELIKSFFTEGYTYSEIVKLLKWKGIYLSLTQLKRIIKSLGLKRKNIEENLELICVTLLEELNNSGSCLGYKTLWRRLVETHKLNVKRQTVLDILRIVDPDGISERLRHRLRRRRYSVPGPNFIWHMDGYDKIKPYGFAIHGAIDGYSRKILWLKVATTNNKPQIIAHYYLKTVKKLKCIPTMIRSDKGTENSLVECLQISLRHSHNDELAGFHSFIKGKSTANQRIESLWGQLRRHALDFWIILFKEICERNLFDVSDEVSKEAMRYCFGPLIQYDLDIFKKEWNQHKIRKQRGMLLISGKPNLMFYLPEEYGGTDCKKSVNEEDLNLCLTKYCMEPQFCNPLFFELVKILLSAETVPSNVESALNLCMDIMEAVKLYET